MNRRTLLKTSLAAGLLAGTQTLQGEVLMNETKFKQSLASWCYSGGDKWTLDRLCQIAKELGCSSVELVTPAEFPTLQKHGLSCAMSGNTMPGVFKTGFNNLKYHDELVERTGKVIEACAAAKFPNVIGFIGYKYLEPEDPKSGTISRDDAIANSIKGLKRVMPIAEKLGVNVCIEHLNSRDGSHPMKGHPGYQGDDLELVAEVIRKVGSPRCKLLFDVYHVQIMHGDVIRRLEECKDILGHIHTAGNPGRGELDENQELNYKAIAKKLKEMKYDAFVGHEFLATKDPLECLKQAVQLFA